MNGDDGRGLPPEIIHRFTEPLARFLKIEAAGGALLILAVATAILVANSEWSESYFRLWNMPISISFGSLHLSHSLRHLINEGLMTLFFFVVALELKRELVLGELRSLRLAMLPFAGAVGGMLFPVIFYAALLRNRPEIEGWGTVMATDTALMIACLALAGSRIPAGLRLFFLSLAIFDDAGAILVVTLGYGESLQGTSLILGIAALVIVAIIARLGVRSITVYSLLGILIWYFFDSSGIHPTVVGVILGLMTPTGGWVSDERLRFILRRVLSYPKGEHWSGDTVDRADLRMAGRAAHEVLSPVERLEMRLHPWIGFGLMPIFALANAGVVITGEGFDQRLPWAIVLALVIGKPLGILFMSWLAVRSGLALLWPHLTWSFIAAGSLLAGIGFTMSLFIAGIAFPESLLPSATIGILVAGLISGVTGLLALMVVASRSPAARQP